MSIHIAAQHGEIADKILLPGDPLRAKFIAENFLEDAVCFNEVRNMFGYTGTYKGHRVSVMGTGMGMPSISIYARELIVDYGVKKLIRVGTAGSLNEDVHAVSYTHLDVYKRQIQLGSVLHQMPITLSMQVFQMEHLIHWVTSLKLSV